MKTLLLIVGFIALPLISLSQDSTNVGDTIRFNPPEELLFHGHRSDVNRFSIAVTVKLNPGDTIYEDEAYALNFLYDSLRNGKPIISTVSDTVYLWANELNSLRTVKLEFDVDVLPVDTILEIYSNAQLVNLSTNETVLDLKYGVVYNEDELDLGVDEHLVGRIRLDRTHVVLYRKANRQERRKLRDAIDNWEKGEYLPTGATPAYTPKIKMPRKEKKFRKRYTINGLYKFYNFERDLCEFTDACIEIENIEIEIAEGRIDEVRVYTSKGLFTNNGPLSLTNYEKRKFYRLYYAGTDFSLRGTNLVIGDFLVYEPTTARKFFPSKAKIKLTDKGQVKDIISRGDPLSFVEGRVYTDAKGLSGEDNGLVMTELHARFIANSNAIGSSPITMAQFLHLNLNWSKFDSDFDTLKLNTFDSVSNADYLNLLKRSNAMLSAELDLFRGSRVHDMSLRIGARVYNTRLSSKDTNFSATSTLTPAFTASLNGTLYSSRMIELNLALPGYLLFNHDQPFANITKVNAFRFVVAPEIEIRIQYPEGSSGQTSRMSIFGRARYYDMPFGRGGNFWQIQTGVQVPISTLFKGNG